VSSTRKSRAGVDVGPLESWNTKPRAGKCRDAAGARTVFAAAGAWWEDERRLQPPCVVESAPNED
jgi:hypothetical protein